MSFTSLIRIEATKLKRSRILLLFLLATIIVWFPSVLNADLNFQMQAEGISPEHNFLIQGFLAFSWFMYPAIIVVCTVMLNQIERSNRGLLKMYSLPISCTSICLAKFSLLLVLAFSEVVLFVAGYYISAIAASQLQNYFFVLSPLLVGKEAILFYLSSIPLISIFWMFALLFRSPVFSIVLGLFSIIPSVFLINTKYWFTYPMCYPFYLMTSEYGTMASGLKAMRVDYFIFLPVAVAFVLISLTISCTRFMQKEMV